MPTAKKNKNGTWTIRIVDHYEFDGDGNRKVVKKSFTADSKKLCENLASEWLLRDKSKDVHITVKEAIELYIQAKSNSLSETTIVGYRKIQRVAYKDIENVEISKLETFLVQMWINGYLATHSVKTAKNVLALLTSACKLQGVELPKITMPKKKAVNYIVPTDDDVMTLLNHTKGTDMYIPILLGSLGLRLGEICALTDKDLIGSSLIINKSKVRGEDGYLIKSTKTYSSTRIIQLSDNVTKILRKIKGPFSNLEPATITKNFRILRRELGLREFRFHDLRHYYASTAARLQIPRNYIERHGGWDANSSVLSSVYINTLTDAEKIFTDITNEHYDKLLSNNQNSQVSNN